MPRLPREARDDLVILRIQLDVIPIQIFKELLGSQNLGNLDQLVGVASSMEEGLFAEDHGSKHCAKRPHIQRIIIFLEVDKQFGTLEISRRDSDVIFGSSVVELGKTPINQSELNPGQYRL